MRNSYAISAKQRETLLRWFKDPDTWVGVYQNKDLTSPDVGRRIAYSFSVRDLDKVAIGSAAPDTKFCIGWRYRLIQKCGSYQEVLDCLNLYDGGEVLQ